MTLTNNQDQLRAALEPFSAIARNCGGNESDSTVLYVHQCLMSDIPLTIGDFRRLSAALEATPTDPVAGDVERARQLLKAWQQWEADLIASDEAWDDEHGFVVRGEFYDRYIELQARRETSLNGHVGEGR